MRNVFRGRDFLTLMDFTKEEVSYILEVASDLKRMWGTRESHRYLEGRTIALLFERHSTRTRISFQAAVTHLGGTAFYMRPDELQLVGRGEPIKDTARVVDRYCDGLVIRTVDQERMEEFAKYMKNPVINACTNLNHPCQGLADLLTIKEKKGQFEGLKLAYSGDPFNDLHSLMIGCSLMGIDIFIAHPEGYNVNEKVLEAAKENARKSGSKVVLTTDLHEAVNKADIIYANTWHCMGPAEAEEEKKIGNQRTFCQTNY